MSVSTFIDLLRCSLIVLGKDDGKGGGGQQDAGKGISEGNCGERDGEGIGWKGIWQEG